MLKRVLYFFAFYLHEGKGLNIKKLVSILLIVLLAGSCSLVLTGKLSLVRADDNNTNNGGSPSGITVVNVSSTQNFVEEGFSTDLTATVQNTLASEASANVTICGNGIALNTQVVSLDGDSSTIISYEWNTTGFALGNYTLSAYTWPILGQTALDNANVTGSIVLVTCPGDQTGHFKVDFTDIITFVSSYINYYQTGYCDPAADFEHSSKLDFNDVTLFVASYLAYYAGPTPFVTDGGLTLTMSPLKQTIYSPGEPINFTLSINNVSKYNITFDRSASTFDYLVYNKTGIVYRYTFGVEFPLWIQLYTLAPGMSLSQSFEWDQECNLGYSPVASAPPFGSCPVFLASPGTYYIMGEALGMQTIPQQITIAST